LALKQSEIKEESSEHESSSSKTSADLQSQESSLVDTKRKSQLNNSAYQDGKRISKVDLPRRGSEKRKIYQIDEASSSRESSNIDMAGGPGSRRNSLQNEKQRLNQRKSRVDSFRTDESMRDFSQKGSVRVMQSGKGGVFA
jgi:hypothetical protein